MSAEDKEYWIVSGEPQTDGFPTYKLTPTSSPWMEWRVLLIGGHGDCETCPPTKRRQRAGYCSHAKLITRLFRANRLPKLHGIIRLTQRGEPFIEPEPVKAPKKDALWPSWQKVRP
jgi:hypothetical protein